MEITVSIARRNAVIILSVLRQSQLIEMSNSSYRHPLGDINTISDGFMISKEKMIEFSFRVKGTGT